MTRSTNFTPDTYDLLSLFERPGDVPTRPAGIPIVVRRRRRRLRPTWTAVAMSGIVGTLAGVVITVLSLPVVG